MAERRDSHHHNDKDDHHEQHHQEAAEKDDHHHNGQSSPVEKLQQVLDLDNALEEQKVRLRQLIELDRAVEKQVRRLTSDLVFERKERLKTDADFKLLLEQIEQLVVTASKRFTPREDETHSVADSLEARSASSLAKKTFSPEDKRAALKIVDKFLAKTEIEAKKGNKPGCYHQSTLSALLVAVGVTHGRQSAEYKSTKRTVKKALRRWHIRLIRPGNFTVRLVYNNGTARFDKMNEDSKSEIHSKIQLLRGLEWRRRDIACHLGIQGLPAERIRSILNHQKKLLKRANAEKKEESHVIGEHDATEQPLDRSTIVIEELAILEKKDGKKTDEEGEEGGSVSPGVMVSLPPSPYL